jgi:hypothetical protein
MFLLAIVVVLGCLAVWNIRLILVVCICRQDTSKGFLMQVLLFGLFNSFVLLNQNACIFC